VSNALTCFEVLVNLFPISTNDPRPFLDVSVRLIPVVFEILPISDYGIRAKLYVKLALAVFTPQVMSVGNINNLG
jgi:hypothetical protein